MNGDHMNTKDNLTKEQLKELLTVTSEGLWYMANTKDITFFNQNFYSHFDLPLNNPTIDDWKKLIHPEDQLQFTQDISTQLSNASKIYSNEYRVKTSDHQYIWIQAKSLAKFDQKGNLIYMIGSHKNITEQKSYERRIFDLAFLNQKTKLLNENKLNEDLKGTIAGNYIILIELENFDILQKTYPKIFIEELIALIAKKIKRYFNIDITIYQKSLTSLIVKIDSPKQILEKNLKQLLNFFEKVIVFEEHHIAIDTSLIGYQTTGKETGAEEIIEKLYLTLSYNKNHQNNSYQIFNPIIQAFMNRKFFIKSNIKTALNQNHMFLVFHPIMDCKNDNVYALEALVRWHDRKWGRIYPDEFIPLAEKNDSIHEIGLFVIKKSCEWLIENQDTYPDVKISVNVSVIELMKQGFLNNILTLLNQHNLRPDKFIIEITESNTLNPTKYILEKINNLINIGFEVALDDFGSGYSSFNTLLSTPVTLVKMDKQLINNLLNSEKTLNYIDLFVKICHDQNIKVVAEGIETTLLETITHRLNINFTQGYLYTKPRDRKSILDYLDQLKE